MLPGTLELLILKTLSIEPTHGWGITRSIERMSDGMLKVNQGSLYPALNRLTELGWITSSWQKTAAGRRARYYELTPAGGRSLPVRRAEWERAVFAMKLVLERTELP